MAMSLKEKLEKTLLRSEKLALSVLAISLGCLFTCTARAEIPAANSTRVSLAPQPTKAEILTRLHELQGRQTASINLLEESLKKQLKDSTQLNLRTEQIGVIDQRLSRMMDQMTSADSRRNEMIARRELTDQLILAVDSRYTGQMPLQKFLEIQLLDLSQNELTNPAGSGKLWKFVTYLSVAIREIPEPQEDLVGIVESYMNFGSVLNPRPPTDFLASRSYTDGASSVAARPIPRELLGDYVEKKQELSPVGSKKTVRMTSAARGKLELNMKPILPPADPLTPGNTISGATTSAAPNVRADGGTGPSIQR